MFWYTVSQYPVAFTNTPLQTTTVGNFIFNGFNLSDCGEIALDTINYDDMNRIQIDTYDSPRTDWWWVLGYYVKGKNITAKIIMIKDTEDELNDAIDELKVKLFKQEWLLKIKVNGTYRQAKASVTDISFNRDFEKKTILSNVSVSRVMMENFQDEDPTYNTDIWVNVPVVNFDIENIGARADYLFYIIFGTWLSWVNTISIEKDWYTLTINQSIANNDILIIDWVNKSVIHNGISIDYDWPFLQLENGSNPIVMNINGTYIADITWLYHVNYL